MNLKSNIKRYLRYRLGHPLQSLGYATGVMQLTAMIQRVQGAIILMYHSVADNPDAKWIDPSNHVPANVFDRQMAFLSQERNVISLSRLIDILQQGKTPVNGTVVITFDDGYNDNLTIGAPILDLYGMTATLFLPTGYIDRGRTHWIDNIYTAFKFRKKNRLNWKAGATVKFDLENISQYYAAYRAVCDSILLASSEKRSEYLDALYDQLNPSEKPSRLTMNWEDVNNLLTRYQCFQIGGHSLGHTDMTRLSDEEARYELDNCAKRIKEVLGYRPRYFSFPYGRTSERLRQFVSKSGYEAACGGGGLDPVIKAAGDLYRLPRVEASASMDQFDLLTSPSNTGLWRKLGRKKPILIKDGI